MQRYIERPVYLEKLQRWRDKEMIKVITGIRRAGKSVLLKLFIDELKKSGVSESHIIALSFEDPLVLSKLGLTDNDNPGAYGAVYNYIKERADKNPGKTYVFLDEIQQIPDFEKAVDGLYIQPNIDLYITGSNANLLSGELATLLSGRYIEIKVLPLSFKEYTSYYQMPADEKLYLDYINKSSFPYAINLETQEEVFEYIEGIYNTILVKDVAQRRKLVDNETIRDIAKYVFSTLGTPLSVKNIADTLTTSGRPTSPHTVESYLSALVDSRIFYEVGRFDIKGKQLLRTNNKYYTADVAMRYAELGRRNLDAGRMLENVVFLELLRRNYRVSTGRIDDREVDFYAEKSDSTIYVQVAYTVRNEDTLLRELASLRAINDHYPKLLLTMDVDPEVDYDGIRKMNVLDWLME